MKKEKKKKVRLKIHKIIILIVLLDILCIGGMIFCYSDKVANFFITTAMTTKSHKYLAYALYGKKRVEKVLAANYIEEVDEEMNLDDVVIDTNNIFNKKYTNKYEKELFTKDEGNDVYKIIRLDKGYSYKGYLTAVYDPADIDLAVTDYLGTVGESCNDFVTKHNGLLAINGGGFRDVDGWGNGSIPKGTIIQDGKIVWTHSSGKGELIGFTNDNKLYLTSDKPEKAIKDGMRDAVEFGPYLIVNGKAMKVHGDGGWGVAPRTAIGQRKDGVVLLVVIEGRLPGYSYGASMKDLIELFQKYGAYNAANLDGGASSTMSVNGTLWNRPSAGGEYGGRTVSNAWLVTNKQNKRAKVPTKED